jgi:hypothetical protein
MVGEDIVGVVCPEDLALGCVEVENRPLFVAVIAFGELTDNAFRVSLVECKLALQSFCNAFGSAQNVSLTVPSLVRLTGQS